MANIDQLRRRLGDGLVIPACPLALNSHRKLDEQRQRGLFRYYADAGAGGLAVGVHTTQFSIRDPKIGLFKPVLELAATETKNGMVRVAGICGETKQALAEAGLAAELGFDAGLLSLGALKSANENQLIEHCCAISRIIPLFGFYLQPAAGGRFLSYSFWRRFAEIENVAAIKIAPFNRYQTNDVVRAIIEAGRDDIALYTGNDDNIVMDLLTPFRFAVNGQIRERRIVGGLLGHWAVWTRKALALHRECRALAKSDQAIPTDLIRRAVAVTDANAAIFDSANNFAGCIPGIHEVLRRQGLLDGVWCLDPNETLSPGQGEEIDRIYRSHPELIETA